MLSDMQQHDGNERNASGSITSEKSSHKYTVVRQRFAHTSVVISQKLSVAAIVRNFVVARRQVVGIKADVYACMSVFTQTCSANTLMQHI